MTVRPFFRFLIEQTTNSHLDGYHVKLFNLKRDAILRQTLERQPSVARSLRIRREPKRTHGSQHLRLWWAQFRSFHLAQRTLSWPIICPKYTNDERNFPGFW